MGLDQGSDYSSGISSFSRAEAWAATVCIALSVVWSVGGRDGWGHCPTRGSPCASPLQCSAWARPAFASWFVIPTSELVPIIHLDPEVTRLTFRSASQTPRQQNCGLKWEPEFFRRRGQSGLGRERRRWHNGRSQPRCCEKTHKAFG